MTEEKPAPKTDERGPEKFAQEWRLDSYHKFGDIEREIPAWVVADIQRRLEKAFLAGVAHGRSTGINFDLVAQANRRREELNAAKAELERLKGEVRWIPVGERLPGIGQTVLLFDGSECLFGRNDSVSRQSIAFRVHFGEGSVRRVDITHWLPLPPPPLKEGEKS